jgi:hypothetical protein
MDTSVFYFLILKRVCLSNVQSILQLFMHWFELMLA